MLSDTVLFLDIDGVLCTLRSHFAYCGYGGGMEQWDITSATMIRRLCEKHKAAIVISSTWRKNRQQVMELYLSLHGLDPFLYGEVSKAGNYYRIAPQEYSEWTTPYLYDKKRGVEIQEWLDKHPSVKRFVIIDDDSDFLTHQKPFHAKTDTYEGFGGMNYISIDKYLSREEVCVNVENLS